MINARERAIAKLAELTKTPPFVVRAAFDEFSLVAHDERQVQAFAGGDADAARSLAEAAVAQLIKK